MWTVPGAQDQGCPNLALKQPSGRGMEWGCMMQQLMQSYAGGYKPSSEGVGLPCYLTQCFSGEVGNMEESALDNE